MPHPSKFWDRIADKYSKQPVADEESYQKKLEVTRRYLRPDMDVLEIGCGTGSTAILHAPLVKHIQAVDISLNMLEIAKRKAEAAKIDNISFMQSSVDEFSAPEQTFDVVLGLSILHLLEDRDAAISKIYRLLKPGGGFVSSTVCLGESMKFMEFLAPIGKRIGLLPVLRVFTANDLRESMTRVGFKIDYDREQSSDKSVFLVAKKE